ncbi:DUF1822 family protein [Calothrix sp. FACHB-1219]|uniref:DUF1822 family protein n=1 Tax=unclassified Calothrix TaxID=2619626 RepID=UPI001688625C|nr:MULTISPECIES: DUF1822 family protein [unclassified Calothrix]MBD2207428.1 DUF1822 family protein [Calothrix sp. FACHB-168]MBD2222004.1 DUF1822 family protein [Calothrix sp. FACHB-1219]
MKSKMKIESPKFAIIDAEENWLAFSQEDEQDILSSVAGYAYEAARWNAFLNRLCLNAFRSWLEEYLELPEKISLLPSEKDCDRLWEFLNGSSLQLGNNRITVIPTEDSIVEEFCIQQEWVDIPGWEADYYVLIQVNPEERWLRILGYANYHTIKEKAEYNKITRIYSLSRNQLTIDLNVMLIEKAILPEKKLNQVNISLPKISAQQARELIRKIDIPLWYSPRLDFDFGDWAGILVEPNFRNQLYRQIQATPDPKINLSDWLQGWFDKSWHTFEELLGSKEANLAYGWRGGYHQEKTISEHTTAIPALIELLHSEIDEEKRLKAAECLGTIAPGNLEAIAALIGILNNSKNKWHRQQAIESLGEIGNNNQQAIAALSQLLSQLLTNNQDDDLRWQVALTLGKIDTHNHPKAIGRCRKIDLGITIEEKSLVLLVYLMPKDDHKVAVLLKVLPTGHQIHLPPGLQLIILDATQEVFDQVTARDADNCIQLEFTYQAGDSFFAKIALGDVSYTEEFVS